MRPITTLFAAALAVSLGTLLGADESQSPLERLERIRRQEATWRAVRDRPHSERRLRNLLDTPAPLSLTGLSEGPELPVPFALDLEEEAAYERAWLDSLRQEARIKRRVARLRRAARARATPAPVSSEAATAPEDAAPAVPAPASSTPRAVAPSSATWKTCAPLPCRCRVPPSAPDPAKAYALRPQSDPLDLGDAYYDAGAFREALAQYGAAATQAGIPSRRLARARFGLARALERLGRVDGALSAYESVSALPDSEPWTSAADFGHRFLSWKHRLNKTNAHQSVAREVQ